MMSAWTIRPALKATKAAALLEKTVLLKPAQHPGLSGSGGPDATAPAVPRYHALDCVRATAMFLGVFYHLQFMNSAGAGGFG